MRASARAPIESTASSTDWMLQQVVAEVSQEGEDGEDGEEEGEGEEAPVPVAEEAEGLRLHLSSNAATGYKNVRESSGRFEARICPGGSGRQIAIGRFDTAVEAAVAYARAVGEYLPPTGLRVGASSASLLRADCGAALDPRGRPREDVRRPHSPPGHGHLHRRR